ncbi:hypothetical protein JDV02_009794 [Purpureocillium takamizusanense]|uniref:Zn(2)-C6 fungal-type domain-containing protein n=1 Tax=Purpureocillium takamizusanense TaxID=2060973 RepID=A0A9Q8QSP8_9HYPO|nr:uncharacterized protein JDV02_009794 [Purpureocillium takamizusanense]UNI24014.1 hypothetical protein JDV02_009794 [Purpureocillium takamizusanense]
MPRTQTRTACERCRKKRARCDGGSPCKRCQDAHECCVYDLGWMQSKAMLRARVEELQRTNLENRSQIRALQSTIRSIVGECEDEGKPVGAADGSKEADDSPGLWSAECNTPAKTPDPSTILSLPPRPLDVYASQSHLDVWTRTGWTVAHIRHLFDVLGTWDSLALCLLSRDVFLRDYQNGSGRFCSSALVHALLALSARLVNGASDNKDVLPSRWVGSKIFSDEAAAIIENDRHRSNLPNVQALGVLSLYRLRLGQEADALRLAEALLAGVTELCQCGQSDGDQAEYTKALATTYCSAVSLVRMLSLTTGRLFDGPDYPGDGASALHQLSIGGEYDIAATFRHLPTRNSQLLSAKLFLLTEWVYKLAFAARAGEPGVWASVVPVYTKCLDWYSGLFELLVADEGRTPFALFIHMYYHFCLLCLFKPFLGTAPKEVSEPRPIKICAQAAQSILALAQSHDDLFTLQRVSGFVPYFVCASGLLGVAMDESGSRMNSVHLRHEDAASLSIAAAAATATEDNPVATRMSDDIGQRPFPAFVKISAPRHALLLLAKIGLTHPAARAAHRLLLDEKGTPSSHSPSLSST